MGDAMSDKQYVVSANVERNDDYVLCGGVREEVFDTLMDALDYASNAATWADGVDTVYVTDAAYPIDGEHPAIYTFTSHDDALAEYRRSIGR